MTEKLTARSHEYRIHLLLILLRNANALLLSAKYKKTSDLYVHISEGS